MIKIVVAAMLSIFVATPALAASHSTFSLGAGYGFDNGGVFSIHGDFDISELANRQPLTARFGYDHYSPDYVGFGGNYSWSYNVFYGGAYYDFNRAMKLDPKIHPFAGVGLGVGTVSCTGSACGGLATPSVGGLYLIAGAQYDLAPRIAAEVNINGWGGLTVGANFKF